MVGRKIYFSLIVFPCARTSARPMFLASLPTSAHTYQERGDLFECACGRVLWGPLLAMY